jgi:hypothetical protein
MSVLSKKSVRGFNQMKTNDLIRILQSLDPSGDKEVVIGNVDIKDVQMVPAYDRGWYHHIDCVRNSYGSITKVNKARYVGSGYKITLSPYSIADVLKSWPSMKVEVVGDDPSGYKKQLIEGWRPQPSTIDMLLQSTPSETYTIPIPASVVANDDDDDDDEPQHDQDDEF